MKSFIYYDLEEVLLDDARQARAIAPDAGEFIARGTRWPEELKASPPLELPNPREVAYQDSLMAWINELFPALNYSLGRTVLLRENGISLLEIVRYRFLFEFAEVEQRWNAVSQMLREGAERILWVVPREESSKIKLLTSAMPVPKFEVLAVDRSTSSPGKLWRLFRRLGRRLVDRVQDGTEALTSRHRHSPIAGTSLVIVEYYPNSAKTLIPVTAALRQRHGIETVWIAGRRPVKRMLARHGIPSISLRRLTPNTNRTREHFGIKARAILKESLESLPNEIFRGTGSSQGKSFLLPAILETLPSLLEESAFWLDSLLEAFGTLRPRCVVSTTYSSSIGRAAALAAREQNACSVYVQHGMFADYDIFTDFCNDSIFVWGNANRRTMMRNGIIASRIKVVGAAAYDGLIRRTRLDAPTIFRQPGGPLKIAYMASRTGGQVVSASVAKLHVSTVVKAASQIPNGQLTVKLHPSDKTRVIEEYLKDYPSVKLIRDGNSQDIILRSDIVITVSSTTGLEACIADKPLIVLETKGLSEYGPYRKYGAAMHISVEDDRASSLLADTVRFLASNPSADLAELAAGRRLLIDDLLNGGRGDAIGLTAQAIADLVEGKLDSARPAGAAS